MHRRFSVGSSRPVKFTSIGPINLFEYFSLLFYVIVADFPITLLFLLNFFFLIVCSYFMIYL